MRSQSRARRDLRAAVAAAALLSSFAGSEALAADEEAIVGVTALVGLAAADGLFTVHDFLVAARGERPTHAWALAETIVTAPQAVALNTLLAVGSVAAKEDEQSGVAWVLVPTIGVSTMAVHGSWSLNETDPPNPAVLLGVSLAVGIDMALSSAALGRLLDGEWVTRGGAWAEVVLTAPQVALGVFAATKDASSRDGWIALTAWSGVLFLHGVGSLVYDASERSYGHRAMAPPLRLSPAVVEGPAGTRAPALVASGAF